MPPFPAASRRAVRLAPEASSETPLGLPATACSAPLAPPERTGRAARRVTLHHTASEPLDRSSPRTDRLVRIASQNPCTVSGVVHYRASHQGYPCLTPSFAGTTPQPVHVHAAGTPHRVCFA